MNNCKNCKNKVLGNFCSSCGQPAKLIRIDGHYLLNEIEHVLHFDKGILYTIKKLLTRPGQTVREFITEDRGRLVKPILFIVLSSLIYTLVSGYFHVENGYIMFEETKKTAISDIFNWIQSHYGYANIIMGMFIAIWLKVFFKKKGYNFFEILILFCFVMGIGMLLFSLFTVIEGIIHIQIMQIAAFFFILYNTWATGQFFDGQKIMSYIKSFFAYILGMLSFVFFAVLLGIIIDFLTKH